MKERKRWRRVSKDTLSNLKKETMKLDEKHIRVYRIPFHELRDKFRIEGSITEVTYSGLTLMITTEEEKHPKIN